MNQNRMLLDPLCSLQRQKHFVELVLYYQPGRTMIKPYLHGLDGRELTRAEWQQFVALVDAWYRRLPITDQELIDGNMEWEQVRPDRRSRKRTKTKDRQKDGWIYVLKGDRFYKIGQAVRVDNRVTQIEPALPFPVEVVHSFPTDNMDNAERELHRQFADKQIHGEWFALDDADLEYIKSLATKEE